MVVDQRQMTVGPDGSYTGFFFFFDWHFLVSGNKLPRKVINGQNILAWVTIAGGIVFPLNLALALSWAFGHVRPVLSSKRAFHAFHASALKRSNAKT